MKTVQYILPHFCVLGEDFQNRKLVTIYRIGDADPVGDELDSLPCSAAGKLSSSSSRSAMQLAHEMNPKARLNICWDWSRVAGRKSRIAILRESPWLDAYSQIRASSFWQMKSGY
jgi:hypothetical protein